MPPEILADSAPQAREAEEAIIGAVLINPGAYYDVADFLSAQDFYLYRHRFIWEAIARLVDKGSAVDFLTISAELESAGKLAEIGGQAYLTALINLAPSSLNAVDYGRLVEQASARRRILNAANEAAKLATSSQPLEAIIEGASAAMLAAGERALSRKARPLSQAVSDLYDRVNEASAAGQVMMGLPTGFVDLDRILNGLSGGKLVIVAGRPGTGKTSFLLSLARNMAVGSHARIALFSLEMDEGELGERLLAQETRIDSQRLRSGQLRDAEWAAFTQGIETTSTWPILVDDTPLLTPAQLRMKCKLLHAEAPLDLVMVDYLQLMSGGGRFENRQVEVSYISRQLKALAKDLGVPVVAAAQLSRAVEQRADKRPVLSDLRESGSIEQDADQVIFLYRPDGIEPVAGGFAVDFTVAKHRSGPTGDCQLLYSPTITRFDSLMRGGLNGA